MSKALSPRSTTRSADSTPAPLLTAPAVAPMLPVPPEQSEQSVADGPDHPDGDPHVHRAGLLERVLVAVGEVEAVEWALDQLLEDAASGEEVGIGLDVAPLDGALESARWALDGAVGALHAELRFAASRGVPLALLAEVSGTEIGELRSVLSPSGSPGAPGRPPGDPAPAV